MNVGQSTTNMEHSNMMYQMEPRVYGSQQLADRWRGGGNQLRAIPKKKVRGGMTGKFFDTPSPYIHIFFSDPPLPPYIIMG